MTECASLEVGAGGGDLHTHPQIGAAGGEETIGGVLGDGTEPPGTDKVSSPRPGFLGHGGLPEWSKGAVCKTAGSAYVGSNPTPATN
jgi:hypothetical protein